VKDFLKDEKKHIPDSFVRQPHFRNSSRAVRQRPLQVSRLSSPARTTLGNIARKFPKNHPRLHAPAAAQVAEHRQPGEDRTFTTRTRIGFIRKTARTCACSSSPALRVRRTPLSPPDWKRSRQVQDGRKFEDLARTYSQEPSRRSKGGDWGWMKRSDLNLSLANLFSS